jgi:hypothetical protein
LLRTDFEFVDAFATFFGLLATIWNVLQQECERVNFELSGRPWRTAGREVRRQRFAGA